MPSGRNLLYHNRVAWAVTYLAQAGVLDRTRRSFTRINDRGRRLLQEHPHRIDNSVLEQFEEFRDFTNRTRAKKSSSRPAGPSPDTSPVIAHDVSSSRSSATPEEAIDAAYQEHRAVLADELLERIAQQPPEFFEQLVLDVLLAMGYGGSKSDAAERLGRSGDGASTASSVRMYWGSSRSTYRRNAGPAWSVGR